MKKQISSQKNQIQQVKKITLAKQPPISQAVSKPTEKVHTDKFVLQPITTVSGQKKLKKYQKIKKIGKGTYSQCFLVKTVGSDSQYALKIIPKNKLQVLIRQKLIYEIKIQQQLSHQNVVYLDHWFQDQEFQYIFMQYCPNGNLQTKLQQLTQFPQSLIRFYTLQIIQSLMYIHSKGILHRDLKMCNFYLDQNGNIKLGDFGFACQLNHANQLKRQSCGTPNYIAPQAISGFGYSYSADVWALGVILYRMKFAYCPFESATVKQTLQNVKLCKYTFPKNQKISSQLKDLISKIFNINYDQRLTLQQIACHPFFQSDMSNPFSSKQKGLTKQKRGFSLSRLFSSSKQKSKLQKITKNSPKNSSSNKNAPVRSNSCQTFKKIKQTFKDKNIITLISSNTLPTQENVYLGVKTQSLTTLGSTITTRENGSKNVREIIDIYNNLNGSYLNEFSNKNDKNSRLTQFLAKQKEVSRPSQLIVKKEQKLQEGSGRKITNQRQKNNVFDQLLAKFQKKYILPASFIYYKDITIISFSTTTKLIVYTKQSTFSQQKPTNSSQNIPKQPPIVCEVLVLYKNKYSIYTLGGEKVEQESLSKVLNYVIDKKISFEENIESQQFFNPGQTFQSVIHKLPNIILQRKEGILMIYGTTIKGYLIGKSQTQQLQYLASLEEKKLNTLFKFNESKNLFQVEQGPVLAKIYSGWTNQLLSIYFDK